MQAALQPYVDNAISKTVSVPEDTSFAEFSSIYERAHAEGLEGCTVFRPNPATGAVLSDFEPTLDGTHCCGVEREAD